MKLTSHEIYEAALDDDLFTQLPARITDSLGARSCVLHWRNNDGAPEIFSHSGYFSDANMADYATNFAQHDLWTEAGMRQERLNLAWKTTDLVATSEYQKSVFYNEWIRGMGDDTLYCCGAVLQTMHGYGIIGLHRGATQGDFSVQTLHQLNEHIGHLRRMFAIRGRISSLTERRDLLSEIFQSSHEPAIAVTRTGRLITANAAGEAFLRGESVLRLRHGHVRPASDDTGVYDAAVAIACSTSDPQASDCILNAAGKNTTIASFLPLLSYRAESAVLVTIHIAPRKPPQELLGRYLRQMFGLSAAEADIALRLANGDSITQIADQRRSSASTVRTQVKHVLLKMDARRQVDVVRMIKDLTSRIEP